MLSKVLVRAFPKTNTATATVPKARYSKFSYDKREEVSRLLKTQLPNEPILNQNVEIAKSIIKENKITDLRQLLEVRDTNTKLQEALKVIEANKALYTQKNLLLHYLEDKPMKPPVRVTVTGASGAIGYALLFRIASGEMLGKDQPVHLNLLELPEAMKSLEGVVMELNDCAFPLLSGITATDKVEVAFENSEFALLVGASPRKKGQERSDLLKANAAIFKVQGRAMNKYANSNIKVIVVGNPANTNAFIAASNAKDLDPRCFTAMTRLDHNRGLAQLSLKTGKPVNSIKRFAIWGNHSSTQYPDISHTQIEEKWAKDLLDQAWVEKTFIPVVQQRGAAVIEARGASSAASAASAAIDHIHDWHLGSNGEWTSMAVHSDGSYGITPGLYSSFPVICKDGDYTIIPNVPIDEFSAQRIEASHKELLAERDAVRDFC